MVSKSVPGWLVALKDAKVERKANLHSGIGNALATRCHPAGEGRYRAHEQDERNDAFHVRDEIHDGEKTHGGMQLSERVVRTETSKERQRF